MEFKFLSVSLLFFFANLKAQEFKTIGYFPTYKFHRTDEINFNQLTHLNVSFANPDENGNLTTDGVDISSVIEKAHDKGIEVYIALAGAISPLALWENWIKPSNRSDFVHRIVNFVKSKNLQGVDVDLEWGTVNEDYSGFVIELRDSLKKYDLGITAALPGIYRYPQITDEALAAFDWVNIMAYDLTGPWNPESPGPHSPYEFSVNSVQYWSENGLEKDKMVLGVPFYGYDFNDVNNVQGFSYADMIANNPDYAYQDKVEEAYYNGIPTIVDKTNFAIDENLAGVMIWELGQDDYSELSLLNAIFETIQSRTTTSRFYANQLSISPPYPNPTSNSLFLNLSKFPSTQIEIYAPSLKRFQTINVTNSNALSEINLSKYPAGWYIVRLTSGKESKSFKIIKN